LALARSLAKQLLSHLKTKTDPMAREILNSFSISHTDIHLFDDPSSDAYALNVKNHTTKSASILISIRKLQDPGENKGRLESTMCHEIAHVVDQGHSTKWRQAYLYLMNMTSNDLGWRNELTCDICGWYDICASTQCPACTWRSGDHDSVCTKDRGTRLT
jgi:hypothetical protein